MTFFRLFLESSSLQLQMSSFPFPICAIRVHGSNLVFRRGLRCSFNHYKLYVLPQKISLYLLIIQHSCSVLQRLFAAQIPLSFNTFKATLHFHLSYFYLSILLSHLQLGVISKVFSFSYINFSFRNFSSGLFPSLITFLGSFPLDPLLSSLKIH